MEARQASLESSLDHSVACPLLTCYFISLLNTPYVAIMFKHLFSEVVSYEWENS